MVKLKQKQQLRVTDRFKRLSTSKKIIVMAFIIWLIQALPKLTVAITADGELSAKIMKLFIQPRSANLDKNYQH